MTAEIVKPFGDYRTPNSDESVIAKLREMLAEAERGEIVAFAVAAFGPNGYVLTRSAVGDKSNSEMVGAVAMLQADLIAHWKAGDG